MAGDRDNPEPLSSEELIRRAREGYSSPDPEIVEDHSSDGDEAAAALDRSHEEMPARDETRRDPSPPHRDDTSPGDPPPLDDSMPPPPPPPPTSREGADGEPGRSPSSLPPPQWDDPPQGPSSYDEPWTPPPAPDGTWEPPPPPQRSGFARLFGVGRWVLGGIFLVVALTQCFASGETFDALEIGDCFEDPGDGEVSTVDTVDCNELHDYELYARVSLGPESRPWPGETALFGELVDECFARFPPYVGTEWELSAYDFDVFIPVEDLWKDGNHDGLCVIYEFDEGFNLTKAIGTARNSGR